MAVPRISSTKIIFVEDSPVIEGPFFNSELPLLKTAKQVKGSVVGSETVSIPHKLNYIPNILCYAERVPNGRIRLVSGARDFDGFVYPLTALSGDEAQAEVTVDSTNVYLTISSGTSNTYRYCVYIYYDELGLD